MNRIDKTFQLSDKILSIYFSAGYPKIGDTIPILEKLEESGVDIVEIGLPFSDPLADGPVIQKSSSIALENGMTTNKLFKQLDKVREKISIPLVLMGYFNPIMQFGVEKFCQKEIYQSTFRKHKQHNIFLITPQTSKERIHLIDNISKGFIYMVSSSSVTGIKKIFSDEQIKYFERIKKMKLKNPRLIGFGVSNSKTYNLACKNSRGCIIGSAFIDFLENNDLKKINQFIANIRS